MQINNRSGYNTKLQCKQKIKLSDAYCLFCMMLDAITSCYIDLIYVSTFIDESHIVYRE